MTPDFIGVAAKSLVYVGVDPIDEEPERMVAPAALGLLEWILLGSILGMGCLALWIGFGG